MSQNQVDTGARRVGWICTYTPEEIILGAGFTPYRLLPYPGGGAAEELLPPSICPYVRQVARGIKRGVYGDLEGVVVAHSCNAMMHLYNVLREESGMFVYLLDLPRHRGEGALDYFTRELSSLADFLGERGEEATVERLEEARRLYREREQLWEPLLNGRADLLHKYFPLGWYHLAEKAVTSSPAKFNRELAQLAEESWENSHGKDAGDAGSLPALMLAGGIPSRNMMELLAETTDYFLLPENCAGARYLLRTPPELPGEQEITREKMLQEIALSYLEKPPCPRIYHFDYRESYYRRLLEKYHIKGAIYHDLMFCDLSHYDYLLVKEVFDEKEIPLLQVKTELGAEDLGQIKTRLEAFLELLEQE